jgi:hypothetical protein
MSMLKMARIAPRRARGVALGSGGRAYGPTNPVLALFRTDSPPFVNEIGLPAWHRTARGLLHSRSAFGIGLPLTANVCRHLGCGCSSVVEHDLAKVGVEGSSPFARSRFSLMANYRINDRPPLGGLVVRGPMRPNLTCSEYERPEFSPFPCSRHGRDPTRIRSPACSNRRRVRRRLSA